MNIQTANNFIHVLTKHFSEATPEKKSNFNITDKLDTVSISKEDEENTSETQQPFIQKRGYDYYVNENSRMTVKIIDKSSGKTLKEIPSQEEQKIHKAINEVLEGL